MPSPFALARGEARMVIAAFYEDQALTGKMLIAGQKLTVIVESKTLVRAVPRRATRRSGATKWEPFLTFDWWPPLHDPHELVMHQVAAGGCSEGNCYEIDPKRTRQKQPKGK